MSYKTQKITRKLKQINVWGLVAAFFLIMLLIVIGYFAYTKMQIGRMEKELKVQEEKLLAKKQEFKQIVSDPWYKKYEASKYIQVKEKTIAWKQTLNYLIEIYDTISGLDDTSSSIVLEDFNVTIDHKIHMRGEINNINTMYDPGGLIDKFVALETVEFIDIPFYKKNDDVFEFVLEATIKDYEGIDGSL